MSASAAWAMRGGDGAAASADWFQQRLARARVLIPAANFDTVIPIEFAETITTEIVDVAGTADATPADDVSGGAVILEVGDAAITPNQARLQLVGSGSHVADLSAESWYMASLVRFRGPFDEPQLGDTAADMMALWCDDDNRVTIGVLGNASGGSTSQYVGRVDIGASNFTTLGPLLGGETDPWHLFEVWHDLDAETVTFAIDGVEFDDPIDAANLPALSAKFGPIFQRTAIGDPALGVFEKAAIVVASPTPGEE